MTSELDLDTALQAAGDGTYRGNVTDRWGVLSGVPNGGFMICFALRALADAAPQPEPLTLTAHFLRPGRVGPVTVHTELVKVGKRNATVAARVVQEGGEVLRALATFGRFADPEAGAPKVIACAPPPLPPVDDCIAHADPGKPLIAERFDNRFEAATVGWMTGQPSGQMVTRAWMRLADGRPPDALAMPLFADGLPPPLFNAVSPGWVPTIELTVHFRARPVPGWLRSEFRTRCVSGGLLEEDGELWDEADQLVAMSRQLAAVPR